MLYLILPLILLLGAYLCYIDFRTGIIRNRYILMILVLGILYQVLSGIIFTQTQGVISAVLYGFFLSVFLWWLGIWPGGDSKLFACLLLFFPEGAYTNSIVFSYLINTFIPAFAFMIIYALIKSKAREIRESLSYSLNPYKISFIFMILAGFMWFFNGIIKLAGIEAGYFMTILILFVVFEIFSMVMSAKAEILFFALFIARVILDFQSLLTLTSFYYFALVAGTFIFFRFFLLHIAYYAFTDKKDIRDIEPGMVLAEGISSEGGHYERIGFLNSSLIEFLQQKKKKFIHSLDEITADDVSRIKKLRTQGKIKFGTVRIYQTQPFVVFIFIGYLLTLLLQGGINLVI